MASNEGLKTMPISSPICHYIQTMELSGNGFLENHCRLMQGTLENLRICHSLVGYQWMGAFESVRFEGMFRVSCVPGLSSLRWIRTNETFEREGCRLLKMIHGRSSYLSRDKDRAL